MLALVTAASNDAFAALLPGSEDPVTLPRSTTSCTNSSQVVTKACDRGTQTAAMKAVSYVYVTSSRSALLTDLI